MTKVREITIKIELGNDEMKSPQDVSFILNQIRQQLGKVSDVEDINTKYRDANGNTVAHVEFDQRYASCKVWMSHRADELTPEEAEDEFARVVSTSNFIDLCIEAEDEEADEAGWVDGVYDVEMDRDFLATRGGRFEFESPKLKFKIEKAG